ncbi:MAG: carboxypeptidase regulatory-like domain-containing protein [Thermoanaerobaculaceae bacterium]
MQGLLLLPLLAFDATVWVGERSTLLVGVQVEAREVGVAEALATEQGVCLAVQDFAQFTHSLWDGTRGILSTPIGQTTLSREELVEVEEVSYLCPEVARARLGVIFAFDAASLTLTLDLPWTLRPTQAPAALIPEIRAPGWGLGTIRADGWIVREGESSSQAGSLTVSGRAAAGEWRLSADKVGDESLAMREFFWQRRWTRTSLDLGRFWVQLAPLLSGFDFLGTQLAWSNEPLPLRSGNLGGQAPWVGALRSFRGPAPPGSLVKLKLDGATVASQLVGLTGRYEFLDIPVSGRGALVVEVEIYDRHNLLVPQEVRRELVSASLQVLPEGRVLQVVGAGWGGFFGRKLFGGGVSEREGVLFYGFRKALTSWATAEVLAQAMGKNWQVGGGLLATPTPWWFVGAEAALGKEGNASLLESEVYGRAFQVSLRASFQSEGFGFSTVSPRRWDRSLEVRRFFSRWLEVGLWGRDNTLGQERFRWVRPTLALSLRQWLSLRVFPDQQGDLWATVFSQPHPRLRLSALVGQTQTWDALYDLTEHRWQARATLETGGLLPSRITATVGRLGESWWSPTFRLGLSHSGEHTGPYLETSVRLSGLWLRAEYQGVPRRVRGGERLHPRVYLSLTADYAYASGRLQPSAGLPLQQFTGAVAGRLVVVGGPGKKSLLGARVVVVGVGGGVSDAAGRFYIGGIPPGVYEVILDPERLPLELSPQRLKTVVEVQAGLTTRVDFVLVELFGLAGQVRNARGEPLGSVQVVLSDEQGSTVSRVTTDVFGFYRFDEVPQGTYEVQVMSQEGRILSKRTVVVKDFLFDQDLVVP